MRIQTMQFSGKIDRYYPTDMDKYPRYLYYYSPYMDTKYVL